MAEPLANKTVVYVVNDPAFFVSHRLSLALGAVGAGARVYVLTPPGEGVQDILKAGLNHFPLSLDRWGHNPWNEFQSLRQLVMLYRSLRPHLAHHVTIKPMLYGTLAARVTGVPAVVNAVSGRGLVFEAPGLKAFLRRELVTFGYSLMLRHPHQAVVFQNPGDLQSFVSSGLVASSQTRFIRGAGVDLTKFVPQPEPDGEPLVLLAARLLRDKGVSDFIQAAQITNLGGQRARFVLAGEIVHGRPQSISEQELMGWCNAKLVEYLGRQLDMPRLFARSHIVCLPSYHEGLPKVLVEAAACGRAIVAYDIPGIREVVQHGVNGLLVKRGDIPALAAAISTLAADANLRLKMGQAGRRLVEQGGYDLKSIVDQTLALYIELLN